MKAFAISLALASLAVSPSFSDEVRDNLTEALEAYENGDIQEAQELVEYAKLLLEKQQNAAFSSVLPDPIEGWSKSDGDGSIAQAFGFMGGGGGLAAEAIYTNETGEQITLAIVADSPLIAMMAAQFGNPALMSQLGEVRRVNKQKVLLNNDGDVQAFIDNRFLVQIEGSATQDDMVEYFSAIKFDMLDQF